MEKAFSALQTIFAALLLGFALVQAVRALASGSVFAAVCFGLMALAARTMWKESKAESKTAWHHGRNENHE